MPDPITVDQVRKAGMTTAMHGRLAKGGYIYLYQSPAYPQFSMKIYRETRQKPEQRTYYVGETEVPDLQAVADALTALRDQPEASTATANTETAA